jgi:ElaA protein
MTIALRHSWGKDLDAATLYELLKLRVAVSWWSTPTTDFPSLTDGRFSIRNGV